MALSGPLIGLMTHPAYAQQAEPTPTAATERTISIELRDVRLEQALAALTQSTGLDNYVIQPVPGRSFEMVNVKLVEQPMSRAISAIVTAAGGVLTQEDGIYFIRPKTDADLAPTAKPTPQADADSAPDGGTKHRSRDMQIAKIKLVYMLPSDFVKALDDPKFLKLTSSDELFHVAMPLSPGEQFKRNMGLQGVSVVPNGNPSSGTASPAPSQTVATPVTGNTGGIGGTADREDDSFSQGQRGFQRNGQANGQNGAPGGPGGNQTRVSLRPEGINTIVSNDADNALLVQYDDVDDLNRLREIVRLLDVQPKQVLIKAEFVSVNLNDADSFGIAWNILPTNNASVAIPAQAGGSGTASIVMAYATGNAVANLQAALTHDTTNILEAPMISTTNNRPAQINVETIVSVPETISFVGTNGSASTSNTIQVPITATNGLTVLPHINGDNTISLALSPQLESVVLRADEGYDETVENLTTYRTVANGETMVLGGFIDKTDSRDIQKVPLLSDLPIIGSLFTQRSHSVTGSEVLVFVTPTIIQSSSAGVTGSNSEAAGATP